MTSHLTYEAPSAELTNIATTAMQNKYFYQEVCTYQGCSRGRDLQDQDRDRDMGDQDQDRGHLN